MLAHKHGMKPRVVFLLLVLVECFFLVMVASPGVTRPWRLVAAQREFARSHSQEAAQKVHEEQVRARRYMTFLSAAAVIVLIGMIFYAVGRAMASSTSDARG